MLCDELADLPLVLLAAHEVLVLAVVRIFVQTVEEEATRDRNDFEFANPPRTRLQLGQLDIKILVPLILAEEELGELELTLAVETNRSPQGNHFEKDSH